MNRKPSVSSGNTGSGHSECMNSADKSRAWRERTRSSVGERQPDRGMTGDGERGRDEKLADGPSGVSQDAACPPRNPAPFQDSLLNFYWMWNAAGGEDEGGGGSSAPSFHSNFPPPHTHTHPGPAIPADLSVVVYVTRQANGPRRLMQTRLISWR